MILRVAMGVIYDAQGKILLAQRPLNTTQGGLWEFPGGKIEVGETAQQALLRELQEEVAIIPQTIHWLAQFYHAYPDKTVELNVWRVTAFLGEPRGLQGQPLRWVCPNELTTLEFPAGNYQLISRLQNAG